LANELEVGSMLTILATRLLASSRGAGMQTPMEETVVIIAQLEQVTESTRSHLSQEAKNGLKALEQHERNTDQSPEAFLEGMKFYDIVLDTEDVERVWGYRLLEDTLLRARWLLRMLEQESEAGNER
jgi:hypothetical protein